METRIETLQDITVLEVQGKLDTTTANAFQQRIFELIEGGATKIIIDGSHLSYVASAGLRVLLASGKKIKSLNGKILLCNINDMIREVLDISGFAPLFPSFATRDEALKAF
jgi:anti-anti-sigma factor